MQKRNIRNKVIQKSQDEVEVQTPEVETKPDVETETVVEEPEVEKPTTEQLAELMEQLQVAMAPTPAAAPVREKYLYRVQILGQLHGEAKEWELAHYDGQAVVAAGAKLEAVLVVGVSGPGAFSKPLGWVPAKPREARIPSLKVAGKKLLEEYVAAIEKTKVEPVEVVVEEAELVGV